MLEDFCPGDTVILRPCCGCSCWSRILWCRGEVLLGFLDPGGYVLTLCRGRERLTLAAVLPPGGNIEIFCRLDRSCCRWQRDRWQYFFNAP